MLGDKDLRTKVEKFVEQYVRQYLRLRLHGASCDDALSQISATYTNEVAKQWHNFSLGEQVQRWSDISFSDHVFEPTAPEIEKIVHSMVSTMRVMCPDSRNEGRRCMEWARDYLTRNYGIGKMSC